MSKMNIEEGRVYEGSTSRLPVVGDYFYCGNLRTSTVVEILDNYHFRTMNSIYHFEVLKDDKANTVYPGGLGESKSTGDNVSKGSGDGGRDLGKGIQEEIAALLGKGVPFKVKI